MKLFRNIDYSKMLLETLRNFFSVNVAGNISILYKYALALIYPLQQPFNDYVTFRNKEFIIASCKWQIGQLTNVLNYLYDNTLNRIYITQSTITIVNDPMFQYAPYNFDSDFAAAPSIFERGFTDKVSSSLVTINAPTAVDHNDFVATVNQIRTLGIRYTINYF
jgi:hypothetical protein